MEQSLAALSIGYSESNLGFTLDWS